MMSDHDMSASIAKHSGWIKRIVSAAWNPRLLLLLRMTRREGSIVHGLAINDDISCEK